MRKVCHKKAHLPQKDSKPSAILLREQGNNVQDYFGSLLHAGEGEELELAVEVEAAHGDVLKDWDEANPYGD